MSHVNLFKYSLHFSIFSLILLALSAIPAKVYASGDIVAGSIKATYSIYEDRSLSYTLNFEVQNNDSSKYLSSFTFSVPFKEYSALNVSAGGMKDYDVISHEYNSIQINFSSPLQYQNRSSVSVNITVAEVALNASGNPEIDLINPITGQDISYVVTAPETFGNLNLSKNIQKTSSTNRGKNTTAFISKDDLRMLWRKESLYSFRLKYDVIPEDSTEALINLPFETPDQSVYYSKLAGIHAAVYDDVGNVFGIAGEGSVELEFQIDARAPESLELKDTKYLEPQRVSDFYDEFKTVLDNEPTLSEIISHLESEIKINRGFKLSRDSMNDLWYSLEDRELNSFEASLLIHSVLKDTGIKAELRYGYIVEPFEINFPVAWVESELGSIDLFSNKYLSSDEITKLTFGIWNNNEDDLMLGVFSDTPEVIRIEPIPNLEIDRTTSGLNVTSSKDSQLVVANQSNRILKIANIKQDYIDQNLYINSYRKTLMPGDNVLGMTHVDNIVLTTEDGQEAATEVSVSSSTFELSQTSIKTGVLIVGAVVIVILVFFVKRGPNQLRFEEQP
jgi:hypothetical protein